MITTWGKEAFIFGSAVRPGVIVWDPGGGTLSPVTATARGNIAYDQIRVSSRTGNGAQLLTWTFSYPATHSSTGVTGQIAYDGSGNFYWCYSTNQWARIGPLGYSNSF